MLCIWTSARLNSKFPRGIPLADKFKIRDPFLLKGITKYLLKRKAFSKHETGQN